MATIKEIARECNVSIATVSNILNNKGKVGEETRRLVLEKVEKMNYVPNRAAKNLKQRTTRTVGIITEDLTVFNAPEIVDGIDDCLEQRGYSFLLGNLRIYKKYGNDFGYHREFKAHLEEEFCMMRSNQVEGVIYVSAHGRDLSDMLEQDVSMPVVAAYGFAGEKQIPSVVFDDEAAAFAVVSKLLEQENGNFGIIAGEKNSLHTRERLIGCQKALYQRGILYDPECVYYGDWSRAHGYQAAKKLWDQGVRSVFSMNDSMAAGIYDYAIEQGLMIGRDILVGGIGCQISDILRPRLTTVEMPLFEIGHQAGDIVLDLIEGKEACSNRIYKVEGKLLHAEGGSCSWNVGK